MNATVCERVKASKPKKVTTVLRVAAGEQYVGDILLDGKKRVGTLVTLRDVTEEELARRRLVQAEKMTLVGQTLAGVAHELNNPLAALVGYADLLKHAVVPEPLQRPIQQMRDQAIRATRIVRNLLNFARRRNPQRVSVQIGELVNRLLLGEAETTTGLTYECTDDGRNAARHERSLHAGSGCAKPSATTAPAGLSYRVTIGDQEEADLSEEELGLTTPRRA